MGNVITGTGSTLVQGIKVPKPDQLGLTAMAQEFNDSASKDEQGENITNNDTSNTEKTLSNDGKQSASESISSYSGINGITGECSECITMSQQKTNIRDYRPFSAKYVNYVPELYGYQLGIISEWWFPCDFCQSRLGDRQIGSNACTLIVVILSYRIHNQGITILGKLDQPLSRHLISALAESIVDGNEIHERLVERGCLVDMNLTLPEAMKYYIEFFGRNNEQLIEWKISSEVGPKIEKLLFEVLHRGIMEWEAEGMTLASHDQNLYLVLIADMRSVLLVYQRQLEMVTLIDSHGHHEHGAVVVQVPVHHLKDLCLWYKNLCSTSFSCSPTCFEVSFLYFKGNVHNV